MQQLINHINRTTGLGPLDLMTIGMVIWAIVDIKVFLPKWRTLSSTTKANVRLVFILAILGLIMSITMHLRGQPE